MPAARYWRLAQCESYLLSGLELSEAALYSAGTRIDGSATLSCPTPLSSGTLENLRDDSFTSTAKWDEALPLPPGFALVWDFGAAVEVDKVGLAGPSQTTFLHKFAIQSSDDGVTWSSLGLVKTAFFGKDGFSAYSTSAADPYFDNVSLLLHMDGQNGSTALSDVGPTAKAITASGNAQISTAQSKFGGASLHINGTQNSAPNCLTIPQSSDFVFPGDFTIEFWALKTANSSPGYDYVLSAAGNNYGDGGWYLSLYNGSNGFAFGCNHVVYSAYTPTTTIDGAWHHYAVSRSGTTLHMFVDGVQVAINSSVSAEMIANYELKVGILNKTAASQGQFNGGIDELRVTKGVARYTENFTPPTSPFADRQNGIAPDATPLRQGNQADAVSISEYPVSPTVPVVSTDRAFAIDIQDGGNGRIVGTVKEKATPSNTPLRRKVWLLNYNDGRIVRETWSNELTGAYEFTHIDINRTYTVVSLDHTGQYRAVIADNLSPEKM